MQQPLPFEFGASSAADTAASAQILAQDPKSAAKLAQSMSTRYGTRDKQYKEGPYKDGERQRVNTEKLTKGQQKAAREAQREAQRAKPEEEQMRQQPQRLSQDSRARLKRQGAKQTAFLNPQIKKSEEAYRKR